MDDYQAEGLATGLGHIARDIRAVENELKNIRVIMAADVVLKTFQHVDKNDCTRWTLSDLIDMVQGMDYHPDEPTSS